MNLKKKCLEFVKLHMLGTATVLSVIFILLLFIFIGKELVQNKDYGIEHYEQLQQETNEQLADELKLLIKENASEDALISTVENCSVNGSFRLVYLTDAEDNLLIVKDVSYFSNLTKRKVTTVPQLLYYEKTKTSEAELAEQEGATEVKTEEKDIIATTNSIYDEEGDTLYNVGIITDESMVITNWKLSKHTSYVLLAFAFYSMVWFSVVIVLVSVYLKEKQKTSKLEQKSKETNTMIEEFSSEISLVDEKIAEAKNNVVNDDYEEELVKQLLAKSKDEALYPIGIVLVKCFLGDKYFTKVYFDLFKENLQKRLGHHQLLFETGKGEFVVLAFGITEEKLNALYEKIESQMNMERDFGKFEIKVDKTMLSEVTEDGYSSLLYLKRNIR